MLGLSQAFSMVKSTAVECANAEIGSDVQSHKASLASLLLCVHLVMEVSLSRQLSATDGSPITGDRLGSSPRGRVTSCRLADLVSTWNGGRISTGTGRCPPGSSHVGVSLVTWHGPKTFLLSRWIVHFQNSEGRNIMFWIMAPLMWRRPIVKGPRRRQAWAWRIRIFSVGKQVMKNT